MTNGGCKVIFIEEFERFEKGHTYTIEFNERGVIKKATIYIDEMDEEIDVTPYIANSKYWQARVYDRLIELGSTYEERKYWKVD